MECWEILNTNREYNIISNDNIKSVSIFQKILFIFYYDICYIYIWPRKKIKNAKQYQKKSLYYRVRENQ